MNLDVDFAKMIEGLFLTKTPQKLDFFYLTFEVQFKTRNGIFILG